jgi:hypothetical protein
VDDGPDTASGPSDTGRRARFVLWCARFAVEHGTFPLTYIRAAISGGARTSPLGLVILMPENAATS